MRRMVRNPTVGTLIRTLSSNATWPKRVHRPNVARQKTNKSPHEREGGEERSGGSWIEGQRREGRKKERRGGKRADEKRVEER